MRAASSIAGIGVASIPDGVGGRSAPARGFPVKSRCPGAAAGRVLVEAMHGAAGVRPVAREERVRAVPGESWRGLLPGAIAR